MILISLKNTKSFMSHLLIKDTFDSMLMSEVTLSMANTFTINGNINKDFFTDDEYSKLLNKEYSYWQDVKPYCYNIVKGSKVPSSMRIIFLLPPHVVSRIVAGTDGEFGVDDVQGMFINVRYSKETSTITTGISLNTFTLNKSIENAFDSYVKAFLDEAQIAYDIQ